MSPKIIAGGCALGAAALAVFGAFSYVMIPSIRLIALDHNVLLLHFYEGRVRLFWFHSPREPFRVEARESRPIVDVKSQAEDYAQWDPVVAGPPPPPVFQVPIRIGGRRDVPFVGGGWRAKIGPQPYAPVAYRGQQWRVESSFIRAPVWPLAILFMIPPIRDSIRERRRSRRKKRNECVECGYNLTGNISGFCPECGVPIPQGAPGVAPR